MNLTVLEGKIVTDVNLSRTIRSETPVANFRIMNKEKGSVSPLFIGVEVWGGEAQKVAEYARKGDIVIIHGMLRLDTWNTKDTGEKRSQIKLKASKVIIGDNVKRSENPEVAAF
jgi:single-strand DNA-binding protein